MMTFKLGTDVSKGVAFAFTGFFLFSCGDAIVKYLSASYPVPLILLWAQFIGIPVLIITSLIRTGSIYSLVYSPSLKTHIFRGAVLGGQVFCAFVAFSHIPLAQAYTFIFGAPLFSSLIARIWLKETIPLKNWMALLTGFSGILIILRPGFSEIDIGSLAALCSGFFFAIGYIMGRKIGKDDPPLIFGFYPAVFAMVFSIFYIGATDAAFDIPAPSDIGLFLIIAVAGLLGLLTLSWAFNLAPVPLASSFHYTQLIWGTLFGFLFFNDTPGYLTFIGAILIVGSGLYMIWHQRKPSKNIPVA